MKCVVPFKQVLTRSRTVDATKITIAVAIQVGTSAVAQTSEKGITFPATRAIQIRTHAVFHEKRSEPFHLLTMLLNQDLVGASLSSFNRLS